MTKVEPFLEEASVSHCNFIFSLFVIFWVKMGVL